MRNENNQHTYKIKYIKQRLMLDIPFFLKFYIQI